MKLAWLVWMYEDDEPIVIFGDGDNRLDYCARKVRIVYSEVDS